VDVGVEVVEGVAQGGERRALRRPDEHADRQAAAGERGGGVVAPRQGRDGDEQQRLLVGEDAARERLLVAARFLAQPAVVLGRAVELEQEADRPPAARASSVRRLKNSFTSSWWSSFCEPNMPRSRWCRQRSSLRSTPSWAATTWAPASSRIQWCWALPCPGCSVGRKRSSTRSW